MIRRVMFSLNRNKQDIYETVASCAVLCRRKNVEPVFFEEDVEQLRENLPELMAQPYCALRVPDPEQIDMIFVVGGDGERSAVGCASGAVVLIHVVVADVIEGADHGGLG